MKDIKEITKWLGKEVKFLQDNLDYVGGYLKLDGDLAVVVSWQSGFGSEDRDDVIQSKENKDYALCVGIKIFNPSDTPDYWLMLSDKEGNIITEETSINPDDNMEIYAKYILDNYEDVKNLDFDEYGVVDNASNELDVDDDISGIEKLTGDYE